MAYEVIEHVPQALEKIAEWAEEFLKRLFTERDNQMPVKADSVSSDGSEVRSVADVHGDSSENIEVAELTTLTDKWQAIDQNIDALAEELSAGGRRAPSLEQWMRNIITETNDLEREVDRLLASPDVQHLPETEKVLRELKMALDRYQEATEPLTQEGTTLFERTYPIGQAQLGVSFEESEGIKIFHKARRELESVLGDVKLYGMIKGWVRSPFF